MLKIVLFVFLVASTIPAIAISGGALLSLDKQSRSITSVPWRSSEVVQFDGSLPEFFIDRDRGTLNYRGSIDADSQRKLLSLAPEVKASGQKPSKASPDFHEAIRKLIFDSGDINKGMIPKILWLGGLCGVLGVQLRSVTNFLGHACYRNDLNIVIWWPYYLIRPLSGFLLGLAVVAVIQAGFLTATKGSTESLWWAAVAFLAGFGEEEFTQRLRLITKTLFGEEKPSVNSSKGDSKEGNSKDEAAKAEDAKKA